MTDLTAIFGGSFALPNERQPEPPELQLRDAIADSGLTPPDQIIMDGRIHRFAAGTKGKSGAGDKSGWYVAFADGVPAGRFGDWRMGMEQTWRADVGRRLTSAEEMAHVRRMSEAKALRDAELAKQREVTADTVTTIWQQAQAADAAHPYLERKGIQPHGARVTGDGRLIVPLLHPDGLISSVQYISHDGDKRYHPGGETGGKYWMIGTMDEPGPLYIAEGFATAATIHEATGRPCIAAYSASNLVSVTGILREKVGTAQDIVVVADNDASGVGLRYAEQASAKYGARVVMPPIEGDANDYALGGHDLLALLRPQQDDWLVRADEWSEQPAPIGWLVKRWIQENALVMVHGPSGGGKTFVVLDWCLRMAAKLTDWHGHRVKPGAVVYLAGEGHHGLRGRIAAWRKHYNIKSLDMWLSRAGCDLNTPEGYRMVVEHIRSLAERPLVIVVDTLHRFLLGDENSAQDAKTMLDACAALMREFHCTVILVHHTGVSDEAQHRARGSSAWRGALDIEISIVPGKHDNPIEIVQRKSKDAEMAAPVYVELEQVQIPGWFDEDGEPVTSAVIVPAEAPKKDKIDSKFENHRKMFENGWWACGHEERNNKPYISRSAFRDYIINALNKTPATADTYLKASKTDRPIGALVLGGVIEAHENGWIVIDQLMADVMMQRNNEG